MSLTLLCFDVDPAERRQMERRAKAQRFYMLRNVNVEEANEAHPVFAQRYWNRASAAHWFGHAWDQLAKGKDAAAAGDVHAAQYCARVARIAYREAKRLRAGQGTKP